MYARVCRECEEYHQDIIQKKISKGCITGVMLTTDKDECYLEHMHEEEETVPKDTMKIKFKQPGSWISEVGIIDMAGFSELTDLLNHCQWVTIEMSGTKNSVNTNYLLSVSENTDKDEKEGD
ncbi:primase [Bacillus phage vB_BcgM]|nr:primase [Bacillus phage vB_BcgM]